MKKTGIVIAAGGGGVRFGKENKLFQMLGEFPVFIHSIRNFLSICPPENFVLSVPEDQMDTFNSMLKKYLQNIKIKTVPGGETRTLSVISGIETLPNSIEIAAVHDAARPLASAALLEKCVTKCREGFDGAIAARPVTDTLKKVDKETIIETIPRTNLWAMETPQVFILEKFRRACRKAVESGKEFTDDAGIMEYSGYKVCVVENFQPNIKITYPCDIKLTENFLK